MNPREQNDPVLKTVRGNSHGGSNPSACANKNGLLLAGRPIFITTVEGRSPDREAIGGFAYRRHRAYHEERSFRGICVARRCSFLFVLCGTISTNLIPSSIPLFLCHGQRLSNPLSERTREERGSHLSVSHRGSEAAREC